MNFVLISTITGLLFAMSELDIKSLLQGNRVFEELNGVICLAAVNSKQSHNALVLDC